MTYGHPVSNRTVDSITEGLELDEVLELTRLCCLDGYGVVERIEILQGVDNGWSNKQIVMTEDEDGI